MSWIDIFEMEVDPLPSKQRRRPRGGISLRHGNDHHHPCPPPIPQSSSSSCTSSSSSPFSTLSNHISSFPIIPRQRRSLPLLQQPSLFNRSILATPSLNAFATRPYQTQPTDTSTMSPSTRRRGGTSLGLALSTARRISAWTGRRSSMLIAGRAEGV
jgi:hypothetical protein